jgi:hypothetical protein
MQTKNTVKMRRFVFTLLIMIISVFRGNICFSAISNIEKKGSWYYIYNEKGKKIKTMSGSIGEIEGFSSTFFIVSKGSWYYFYDENGKHYKTLSNSTGKILSVSGDTFVVQKGSWVYTYNKNGKKINSRAANKNRLRD